MGGPARVGLGERNLNRSLIKPPRIAVYIFLLSQSSGQSASQSAQSIDECGVTLTMFPFSPALHLAKHHKAPPGINRALLRCRLAIWPKLASLRAQVLCGSVMVSMSRLIAFVAGLAVLAVSPVASAAPLPPAAKKPPPPQHRPPPPPATARSPPPRAIGKLPPPPHSTAKPPPPRSAAKPPPLHGALTPPPLVHMPLAPPPPHGLAKPPPPRKSPPPLAAKPPPPKHAPPPPHKPPPPVRHAPPPPKLPPPGPLVKHSPPPPPPAHSCALPLLQLMCSQPAFCLYQIIHDRFL